MEDAVTFDPGQPTPIGGLETAGRFFFTPWSSCLGGLIGALRLMESVFKGASKVGPRGTVKVP
jgi:hypothetical protein